MTSLRAAIEEARAEYDKGRGIPFDQAAVDKITATGRCLSVSSLPEHEKVLQESHRKPTR